MARRRNASKTAPQQDVPPVKLTLTVPAKTAERFNVHAAMTGVSKSALFTELVKLGCKRFVVHDHGGDEGAPPEPAAESAA